MDEQLEKRILEATKVVEEQVDAAIEKLDNIEGDDLAALQRKRAAALKKEMNQKQDWIRQGHGEYSTLSSEKEFFEIPKKSDKVVLHMYRTSTMRCAIVDKHLDILAKKHVETKFCKLDAEKAPFLCNRLRIHIIPTLVLVKAGETIDYIVGFDQLGGVDDFSTEVLEWRLAQSRVILYDGDLSSPPEVGASAPKKSSFIKHVRKNLRSQGNESDNDE